MIRLNLVYLGIIAILVAIIILQRSCLKPQGLIISKTDTIRDTHHDTVTKHDPEISYIEIPSKPVIINNVVHDTVEKTIIDTELTRQTLEDYFLVRAYADTNLSKYGRFIIRDTVTRNRIIARQIVAAWNVNTAITTVTVAKPKVQVYFGPDIGSNGKTLGFGPSMLLKTKTDALYQLGASYLPGDVGMYYHIGVYWEIHL